jgi:SAM-dependent methyltransferase
MLQSNPTYSLYDTKAAKKFAESHGLQSNRILIYRDIKSLLEKYACHGKALDFGCGPGLSTRFIANLGFDTIGVDINPIMLANAFNKPDGIPFAFIEHGNIPFISESFDLVSAIMVLLEEPSLLMMQKSVNEIWRVLKPGGIFLSVVASGHLHKHNWLNRMVNNAKKNIYLKTGDKYTTYSPISKITFTNFVYFHNDYLDVFTRSGFNVLETHCSLGRDSDGIDWGLEKLLNPFTHYVCQK